MAGDQMCRAYGRNGRCRAETPPAVSAMSPQWPTACRTCAPLTAPSLTENLVVVSKTATAFFPQVIGNKQHKIMACISESAQKQGAVAAQWHCAAHPNNSGMHEQVHLSKSYDCGCIHAFWQTAPVASATAH
eukprot:jgi/Ulvmu1/3100/UM015_0140.1